MRHLLTLSISDLLRDYIRHCIAKSVERCTTLLHLDLSQNSLSLNGFIPLLEVAALHPNISVLNLGRHYQFDHTLYSLVDIVRRSATLIKVDISAQVGDLSWRPVLHSLRQHLERNLVAKKCSQAPVVDDWLRHIRRKYFSKTMSGKLTENLVATVLHRLKVRHDMMQEDMASRIVERRSQGSNREAIFMFSITNVVTCTSMAVARVLPHSRSLENYNT